ncbi:MAG: hypothetical protein FWH07_00500 [Oscillospiraceae bacterium]|nr:hypothetical protein [Oscillospiraceae bacterium]
MNSYHWLDYIDLMHEKAGNTEPLNCDFQSGLFGLSFNGSFNLYGSYYMGSYPGSYNMGSFEPYFGSHEQQSAILNHPPLREPLNYYGYGIDLV